MIPIPYKKYKLKCNLSIEQVLDKLKANTELCKPFSKVTNSSKIFQGEISNQDFYINRIITYRNSFLPLISGNIYSDGSYTFIDIKMKLHAFVVGFMLIWFSFLFLMFPSFANLNDFGHIIQPIGMLLFGVVLLIIPFQVEAKKAKYELDRIFSIYYEHENHYT